MGSTLLPQAIEFTVYPPLIFLFGRGDTCDRPNPPLTTVVTHQHRQQLVAVETVGLGATSAPVHFDTG
ncbi:hypothetical protein QFZ98_004397 [Paraburkholderia youngii]